ncbi:MAG: hypothetical protein V1882_00395 [Candidatus Omnitrophota bacterium]
MLKSRVRILVATILLAFVLGIQLIGIQRPFLGHYASYQGTVMASIARNMVRENFSDIFMPKTDSILEGRRSLHLNQYPLPSLLAARAVKFLGGTYELWGRFQAIFFNLLSVLLVFGIARRFFDEKIAWLSAAIYALSPLTVIYGQSFMSESSSLFFFLGSFYLLIGRQGCGWAQVLLSALFFSLAITGRLHWILFFPLFIVPLWWAGPEQRSRKLFFFAVLALALPVAWYAHTYFASLNTPHVHTNLFLQMATSQKGSAFWFRPELYRAVAITFAKNMFAVIALPFFLLGIPKALQSREGRLCLWAGLGVGAVLMFLSPEKLIHHDFYLYAIFPFLVPVTALGVVGMAERFPKRAIALIAAFMTLLVLASAIFSSRTIFTAPEDEKRMWKIAERVREITPPEAPIVIGSENSAIIVFYADRPAWNLAASAVGKKDRSYLSMTRFTGRDKNSLEKFEKARQSPADWLEYLRTQGAAYFVVPEPDAFGGFPDFLPYVAARYKDISDSPKNYHLYELKNLT